MSDSYGTKPHDRPAENCVNGLAGQSCWSWTQWRCSAQRCRLTARRLILGLGLYVCMGSLASSHYTDVHLGESGTNWSAGCFSVRPCHQLSCEGCHPRWKDAFLAEVCQMSEPEPVPEPSGMERTKVGSILTVAVGLVSRLSPFSISLRNRFITSFSVSSDRRMEYRYLSI